MSKLPSIMKHQFSQIPHAEIQRSSFDRSHGIKTTLDSGYLVPIYVDEVLPGDTFTLDSTFFGRLSTPIHPFMDNLFLDTFFFAVPIRLIWDNWQKFNGEQLNPEDSTDYLIPQMVSPDVGGYANGSLSDYFGIPTAVPKLKHSSLWHRAYNLIYNEWYRDQNLQDSVKVDRGDGPDNPADYVLLRRGKRHDYFTSALPWPQKGPSVSLPMSGNAPIILSGDNASGLNRNATTGALQNTAAALGNSATANYETGTGIDLFYDPNGTLSADLSVVNAATINELRQAFQIQKLFERDARGGTRYTEIIRSHFGVVSPDARMQRPEYLGGGSQPINVNAIAQTSSTDENSPQGNLAAVGTVSIHGHGFSKSFTEHCVLIGMVSIRADLNYQQGLNRMFSRETRWDFYWPALAHIGEQPILNKEIYAQGSTIVENGEIVDEQVFGYQERSAEYRYKPSQITGQFRSNFAQSLDNWHLAQDFSSLPTLSSTFIEENPPTSRVVAVTNYPHLLLDGYLKLRCARPMPVYGVPGLIDHF